MALLLNNSSVLYTPDKNRMLSSSSLVMGVGGDHSITVSRESVRINGVCFVKKKGTNDVHHELKPLWDDVYGTKFIEDYSEISLDLIENDKGPPRWFCPIACRKPLKDSPVLLYLPGIDGTGAGLVVHEKALGKVFCVQCLHIPVQDRTPLEGLIQIVEETMLIEHTLYPNKPIYLLGDSFGGALALAVAARNPAVDLVLILANPVTSYESSSIHPLIPLLSVVPKEHHGIFPYVLRPLLGDFIKLTMVELYENNHSQSLCQIPDNLSKYLRFLSITTRILPKDTVDWRMKLVKSVAAYANSRLHAITAQVLVLASGNDNIMPSKVEAKRLSRLLKHCNVRIFDEINGHTVLMESGVNVLSAIKTTEMYRRYLKRDVLKDFLPLSITEFKSLVVEKWWYRLFVDAVLFSTTDDGKIVRGLGGIPDEGPVLLVGNHMLIAIDVFPVKLEFLREKKAVVHGLAHPEFFNFKDVEHFMTHYTDVLKLIGAIPVSGRNLYRLLGRKSYTLLYPGGVREALHRKGEAHKLFWPDQQEFVRMAMKLGATIVPYGGVGEDDMLELILDYDDMKKIPFFHRMWDEFNQGRTKLREEMVGEIANQELHLPVLLPKIPGRLYFKFGKPIRTKGKEKMLDDQDYLQELYLQIKHEVENNIAYLLEKRDEDPYRGIVERILWQMKHGPLAQIPSFEP